MNVIEKQIEMAGVCSNCSMHFTYSEQDIEYEHDYIFFIHWKTTKFVQCPECGHLLVIKDDV